jgi:hypothetical protein
VPRLTADEIEEIRLHARRYSGPFTPTFQKLAANVERLVAHITEDDMACADDLPTSDENAAARDHILRGQAELRRVGPPGPPSCGSCVFWVAGSGPSMHGRCRRHPPRDQGFPSTTVTEWCGEYQARPQPLRVRS